MSSSVITHTFDYIITTNRENINLSFSSINALSSLLGLSTNSSSVKNMNSVICLLEKDFNYFTVLSDLQNILLSHESYSTTPNISLNTTIYLSNGDPVALSSTFANVTIDSAYDYLIKASKLKDLSESISQNTNLSSDYVSNTLDHISARLNVLKHVLVATSNVQTSLTLDLYNGTGALLPLYTVWMTQNLNTTVTPRLITPLTSNDITFITFMVFIFDKGIDYFKNDIPTMSSLNNLGINIDQITTAYVLAQNGSAPDAESIKLPLSSDSSYKLFASNVQSVINYVIPLIFEIKDRVLQLGLPVYYIYYGLFLIAMKNRRTNMIAIAQLDNGTVEYPSGSRVCFYPNGDIYDSTYSILFSGYSGM